MAQKEPVSYLRTHRKKSGLTQRELAHLLGYESKSPVSRHESAAVVPTLSMALAYEAIFQVPVSELFPDLYRTVEQNVGARLATMEVGLQEKSTKGRDARAIAQKLEWAWARRNGIEIWT
jgi:transcriptional regulator with XRE-family HTH domain